MADNNISIKVQADVNGAKTALRDLVQQVRESGRTATETERAAITAAKVRVRETNAIARAERDLGVIGVRSQREINAEMRKVENSLTRLRTNAKATGSDLSRATDAAREKMRQLRLETEGGVTVTSRLAAAWGSLATLAGSLTVVGVAVREAVVFEDALVDLQRAANMSRAEAETMGEAFQDLGAELGMSATSIAALATAAAKAGVAKADLVEFARVTATAAMNFDMLPEEAGESLAKLKNVLGLGVKDMEAFSGALNELADNAAASERDIIEALKLGGSSGKEFGLAAKESAALATTFVSLGASAEQAGTAMRTLLGRLRKASTGAGDAGQALRSVVGDTKSFARAIATDAKGALLQFLAALNQLTAGERMAVLRDIFQEGLDTENISKLAADADKLTEALDHATQSDEELVKSLRALTALKLGSTQAEINRLGAAWRNAGEAMGRLFLPMIRAASIALAALAKGIETVADTFPALSRLVTVLALLAAAWAPLKLAWGAMIVLGGRLKTIFTTITAAGTGLLTAMRAGTLTFAALRTAMGGLLGPIGLVVTGLMLLWDAWNWFADSGGTDPLAKKQQALSGMSDALRGVGDAAKDAKNQIQASMDEAAAPIEALKADYKAATDSIVSELSRKQQAIDHQAQLEMAIIGRSNLSQRDALNATAQAMIRAENAKTAATVNAGRQMEEAWRRTYGQSLEIARAAGMDVKALEQEALSAKLAIYQQQESAYRATVDRLIAEEQRFTQAAKQAEEERMLLKMSVQDRIRALQQKTMTEAQAYADRNRQIEEKLSQANMAKAAGEFDQAKRLTEDAMRLAESNARAVTQTIKQNGQTVSKEVVSEAQAAQTAIGQIARAGQIADQSIAAFGQTMSNQAGAAAQAMQEPLAKLREVKAGIDEIAGKQAQAVAIKLDADDTAARASLAKLKEYAEAKAIVVEFEGKVDAAKDAIRALKDDPENTKLQMQAEVAVDSVERGVGTVQAALENAGLQIPANLNTDELTPAIEEMRSQISQPTESEHTILDNAKEVLKRILGLDGKNTSSTHTVYEKVVPARASGGLVQRFAAGGQAFRRMVGRISGPGTGTSDSVPAMLSNGEYVIRAASVRKYGAAMLDAINFGRMPIWSAPVFDASDQPATSRGADVRLTIAGPRGSVARVSSSRAEAQKLIRLLRDAGVQLA